MLSAISAAALSLATACPRSRRSVSWAAAKCSPLQPKRQRRWRAAAATTRSPQAEGPLLSLAEALGFTGGDPGHWNFSPEWYGTQGGGWGRDAGAIVFQRESECGNGRVTVTTHTATGQPSLGRRRGSSGASAEGGAGGWEEWRVLRFNDVTRQTVMRVSVAAPAGGSGGGSGGGSESGLGQRARVTAQPDCLAQEYLKTTAAVVAALLGLQRLVPGDSSGSGGGSDGGGGSSSNGSPAGQGPARLRALCIGVGGGSLPLFLAHHFPQMDVDAVEIDPAVVAAATQAMGLPTDLPNLRLHCADAAAFLRDRREADDGGQQQQQHQQRQQQQQQRYDVVFMDAFDGTDDVPAALCTPDFAAALGAALHPAHGCFLLNLHSLEGAHPVLTFKAGLLGGPGGAGTGGSCFAVAAQRQRNVCVAVTRGLALPADPTTAQRCLRSEAQRVAEAAGYCFPAGSRACRQLQLL